VPRKAIFLDRDGTINEDPGYLRNPDELKLLPGVGEALAMLKKTGYQLIVISNQSGVGRGLIEKQALPRIHQRLDALLSPRGVLIDHYELCVHRPEDGCDCRKPKPKLIQDAAAKLNIDLSQSYMIGDKISDVNSGRLAGCRGVALVRTGEGRAQESQFKAGECDFVADSLHEIANWILGQESADL
jgi:histidinol-phosphate phosphatase family protein